MSSESNEIAYTSIDGGNFFMGLLVAMGLSIPLWLSFFGWVKLISGVLRLILNY